MLQLFANDAGITHLVQGIAIAVICLPIKECNMQVAHLGRTPEHHLITCFPSMRFDHLFPAVLKKHHTVVEPHLSPLCFVLRPGCFALETVGGRVLAGHFQDVMHENGETAMSQAQGIKQRHRT